MLSRWSGAGQEHLNWDFRSPSFHLSVLHVRKCAPCWDTKGPVPVLRGSASSVHRWRLHRDGSNRTQRSGGSGTSCTWVGWQLSSADTQKNTEGVASLETGLSVTWKGSHLHLEKNPKIQLKGLSPRSTTTFGGKSSNLFSFLLSLTSWHSTVILKHFLS